MSMLGRIIFISGAVIGAGYLLDRHQRRREAEREAAAQDTEERRHQLNECMDGVWSEPRPLIPSVVGDLMSPGTEAAKHASGDLREVQLTPQAQHDAWVYARMLAEQGQTQDVQAATKTVLGSVVPGCDWTEGYAPYASDHRFVDVWESTLMLVHLAELSSKYAKVTQTPGAMVSPGWVGVPPAPTGTVRVGDYLEVLVDQAQNDPTADERFVEWAWVRVDKIEGDHFVGTFTNVTPPGDQPHELAHRESHGIDYGTVVKVPPTFVHRVIHGA
jgi:hypothetical protein